MIDMDGNVYIHMTWLVAKGFKQVQGVDYDGTFSSVIMLKSIQTHVAIASHAFWLWNLVKGYQNDFHEWISEDVYMSTWHNLKVLSILKMLWKYPNLEVYLWTEASILELESLFCCRSQNVQLHK
jgi:hypothetical protein